MIGDYTQVPLRAGDRWTGARMQQGRVLLDHDWNLNIDAAARELERAAHDAIGGAGVRRGSTAFSVGITAGTGRDLDIGSGWMWVGGHAALAPAPFHYSDQGLAPLAGASNAIIVYLDVFEEHVQPAECPADLVDPALSPVQSAPRTQIGYRVRFATPTATTAREAWVEVRSGLVAGPTGRCTIAAPALVTTSDPCAPPGDPGSETPAGLLRIEVLDGGTATGARFAWAFDNGATVAEVVELRPATSEVVIAPEPGRQFAAEDLVELSWLERRADRAPHGALFEVQDAKPDQGNVVLRLHRDTGVPAVPAKTHGLVVRRWDGQAQGSASITVKYREREVAQVTFADGGYQAGDWWGARLRSGTDALEQRMQAEPDGTPHAFAPLAFVDFAKGTVVDLRPKFRPLVEQVSGTCTITLDPDMDLQREIDRLPPGGAEICFAAGSYLLDQPLRVAGRRVTMHGAGPTTVLSSTGPESALVFDQCTEVTVRTMRIEGGTAASANYDGALTFTACAAVKVTDCTIACADAPVTRHSCVTIRSRAGANLAPDNVTIEGNAFEVGAGQIGVLLVDVDHLRVAGNRLALGPGGARGTIPPFARQGIVVGGTRATVVQIDDNQVAGVAQGIHIGLSDATNATLKAGRVQVRGNALDLVVPTDYAQDRHAIFVATADAIQVLENTARVTRFGGGTRTTINGVVIKAPQGPMLVVRDTSLDGFDVGVSVVDATAAKTPTDGRRVWLVEGTMAANGTLALDAPASFEEEHNAPMPAGGKLKSVTVTPAVAGSGSSVQGTVALDAPAGRHAVVVKLSVSDASVATLGAQSVTIAPGFDRTTFTATTTTQPLPADKTVQITAEQTDPLPAPAPVSCTLTVVGLTTVKSLGLAPTTVMGGGGAKVQGTVSITKADPAAVVALSSSNVQIARPAVPSLQVPAGATSATFDVLAPAVQSADQTVAITASLNGSQRTAQLIAQAEPLLKINRIRVLSPGANDTAAPSKVWFDSQTGAAAFFPSRILEFAAWEDVDMPRAIEVEFTGGPVNAANILAGYNFIVRHEEDTPVLAALPQPPNQRIAIINANTVRWVANDIPTLALGNLAARTTQYHVEIVGAGRGPITSQRGALLDAELTDRFPSGDGVPGGTALFWMSLKRMRRPQDPGDDGDGTLNTHVQRAHEHDEP